MCTILLACNMQPFCCHSQHSLFLYTPHSVMLSRARCLLAIFTCVRMYIYRKAPTLINPFYIISFLRVSGGSGTIEVTNLNCANGVCTYSKNTAGCSHSDDLVIQCGEYCIQSCVCVALSALNIWYTFK